MGIPSWLEREICAARSSKGDGRLFPSDPLWEQYHRVHERLTLFFDLITEALQGILVVAPIFFDLDAQLEEYLMSAH